MGEPRQSLVGQTFGGCRIESLIGQGALGAVYRARQLSLDRPVAVKVLTSANASKESIAALLQEAKTLAQVNHPCVVKVYDLAVQGATPYLIMEHLEGETLQKRLERANRLPLEAVVKFATEILQGLQAVHKQGIVHRDLKPSNIFLRPGQKLKLIDFGLAYRLASGGSGEESGGTPEYMAPEQWTFSAVDGRTDLYALGILIWRMMAGKAPFRAVSLAEMREKHLNAPLPGEGFSADARASDIYAIVKGLTLKKPEQRYPNAESVLADLERSAKGEAVKAVSKFGRTKFCCVCETANPESAMACTGCRESLALIDTKAEDLLPPEPPPAPKTKSLSDLNRRNIPIVKRRFPRR